MAVPSVIVWGDTDARNGKRSIRAIEARGARHGEEPRYTITRLVEENTDADLIVSPELFLGGYTTREPE